MKITIGRNKSCPIWLNKPEVSDKHAEVWLENGTIHIQDLNSSNGTFKNGRRIIKSDFKQNDIIKIADVTLQYDALMQKIVELQKGNDYSQEFFHLKSLYINYRSDILKIKREQQKKPLVYRLLFSLIPVIISILFWESIDPLMRTVIMVGGSSLVFAISSMVSLGQERIVNNKMEELSDEFQIKYVCPKCQTRLGMVSWVVLASQKKCKLCGAIWIK